MLNWQSFKRLIRFDIMSHGKSVSCHYVCSYAVNVPWQHWPHVSWPPGLATDQGTLA